MKILGWILLVLFILLLGIVGHYDYETVKTEEASKRCQNVDTSVYKQCVSDKLKEIQ